MTKPSPFWRWVLPPVAPAVAGNPKGPGDAAPGPALLGGDGEGTFWDLLAVALTLWEQAQEVPSPCRCAWGVRAGGQEDDFSWPWRI